MSWSSSCADKARLLSNFSATEWRQIGLSLVFTHLSDDKMEATASVSENGVECRIKSISFKNLIPTSMSQLPLEEETILEIVASLFGNVHANTDLCSN